MILNNGSEMYGIVRTILGALIEKGESSAPSEDRNNQNIPLT